MLNDLVGIRKLCGGPHVYRGPQLCPSQAKKIQKGLVRICSGKLPWTWFRMQLLNSLFNTIWIQAKGVHKKVQFSFHTMLALGQENHRSQGFYSLGIQGDGVTKYNVQPLLKLMSGTIRSWLDSGTLFGTAFTETRTCDSWYDHHARPPRP